MFIEFFRSFVANVGMSTARVVFLALLSSSASAQWHDIDYDLPLQLYRSGQEAEARQLLESLLTVAELRDGRDSPATALAGLVAGELAYAMGRPVIGDDFVNRARAIVDAPRDPWSDTAALVRALDKLASIYSSRQRYIEANEIARRSVAIDPGRPVYVSHQEKLEGATIYHIVPVIYGTNRKELREPDNAGGRLSFGSDRTNVLSVGQAFVTVPADAHSVSQVERPWQLRIPLLGYRLKAKENPAQHFTLRDLQPLAARDLARVSGDRSRHARAFANAAVVFVHGFNVSFENAVFRAAQITYDMGFDGPVFLFSWPSSGQTEDYLYDEDSARLAEEHLASFLKLVQEASGADVHLLAHSMGSGSLLRVLGNLKRSGFRKRFGQIVLASPDVSSDEFEILAKTVSTMAAGVTLYASRDDRALAVAARIRRGVPRAGLIVDPPGVPTIVPGLYSIDLSGKSTGALSYNHSLYADSREMLNDISLIVLKGEHPPDTRAPAHFQRVPSSNGDYWKYRR